MKAILIAVALAAPFTAAAQSAPNPRTDMGYQERMYERYCEKLRESPQAYGQFVHRMRVITGYTAGDFAVVDGNVPAIAACRVEARKLAAAAVAGARPERRPR
jgi:hypothetical protein